MRAIICVLLTLSLVGCAVSKNPNPMIRYAANTGASLAGPGLAAVRRPIGGAPCRAETRGSQRWGEPGRQPKAGGWGFSTRES